MKALVFDAKSYEKSYLDEAAKPSGHQFEYIEAKLGDRTVSLCEGYTAVCGFVNDDLGAETLRGLEKLGVQLVALRCAGFNNVDGEALKSLDLRICRVPEYSPQSVAEFTLAQLLCLTRKVHKSYLRTREMNFTLQGLVGSDIHGKTVGVVGTGKIGAAFCRILNGFGCKILATDPDPNEDLISLGVKYRGFEEILPLCDVISLHAPLKADTHHLMDSRAFDLMKARSLLLNTSRGGLVDSSALIDALKQQKLAGAALDVYEEESQFFFQDFSEKIIDDDILVRLMSFPNVIVSSHQAYLTDTSLHSIAETVCQQLSCLEQGQEIPWRL